MITKLKSIEYIIKTSVILARFSGLSFLLMLDGKNGKNIVEFDLVPKDEDLSYKIMLLIFCQQSRNYIVTEATKLA